MKLVGSVLVIGVNEDFIVCVDNFYNISQFTKTHHTISGILQLNEEPLHHFSKAVAIAHSATRVALGFVKSSKGIVLESGAQIAPIAELTWQKLQISKIAYATSGNLLATGGEDGHVFVYLENQFLLSLPPFPDTISAIAFSSDDSLIFTACFGRSATIFNVTKNMQMTCFKTECIIEDAFFYAENTRVFCITQEGKTLIYSLQEGKITHTMQFQGIWLTTCHKLLGEEFALVGGKDNQLRILRLSDNTLVESIALEQGGITAFCFDAGLLYVGYSNGAIEIIDFYAAQEEMLALLEGNDFKGALAIIEEKNIFLKLNHTYCKKLESHWKETLTKAIDLLAKQQIQDARDLVEPFMSDKAKREEFDYYWQQKEIALKFMDAITSQHYTEVYHLSEQHPYLKDTLAYEEVENFWNKTFETCKHLLQQDPRKNLPKAQELLHPFLHVRHKKDSVIMLLNNSDKYIKAERAYRAKNFVEYFDMTERFPFLKEVRLYKSALLIGEQILQRINALENQNAFSKALGMCKLLALMSPFKSMANVKIKEIALKEEFLRACKTRNLQEAFRLVEEHYCLRAMPECKNLYEDFKQQEKTALSFALAGNGKDALESLRDYVPVASWRDKIAILLKIAYLAEFSNNAPGRAGALEKISWEKTFQRYIQLYGKDEELKRIAGEMGLQEVLENIAFEGNSKGYLTLDFEESLLVIDG